MKPLLSASHLVKTFGDLTAVNDISVKVHAGECLALLGPNGAGKTTTMEMLEGLQKPDRGEISLFGESWSKARIPILQRLGVMLQETQLYKKLTVNETLELFASFYSSSMPIDEAIAMVELQDKKLVRLERLSGGQKQRVYLACAFIHSPDLLFLDEPTTGLDPQSRRMIWDLLLQHKSKKRGILLTTHAMDEAERLSDRIAIIDKGRIIAEGTPRALILQYCGEDRLVIKGESLSPEELRQQLQKAIPSYAEASVYGDHLEMTARNTVQDLCLLAQKAEELKLSFHSIEIRKSSLEDVFLTLTGRSIRDA